MSLFCTACRRIYNQAWRHMSITVYHKYSYASGIKHITQHHKECTQNHVTYLSRDEIDQSVSRSKVSKFQQLGGVQGEGKTFCQPMWGN